MKVVLLAGGLGTRISEETSVKPKPMVEIGGMPILWHIMKIYSYYGFHEFVICLGYKGYLIKEYFANYFLHTSDVTFDMKNNKMEVHQNYTEPWKVTLVETGYDTMTGGRVKKIQPYIGNETFLMTYGDGVGNINISDLVAFHRNSGKIATLTATQPLGKFGALGMGEDNMVTAFQEKPKGDGSWISGGYFVLEPEVFDLLEGDETVFERKPMETLAKTGNLNAYRHYDFWMPMDTLRDKLMLDEMWRKGNAPWKIW